MSDLQVGDRVDYIGGDNRLDKARVWEVIEFSFGWVSVKSVSSPWLQYQVPAKYLRRIDTSKAPSVPVIEPCYTTLLEMMRARRDVIQDQLEELKIRTQLLAVEQDSWNRAIEIVETIESANAVKETPVAPAAVAAAPEHRPVKRGRPQSRAFLDLKAEEE